MIEERPDRVFVDICCPRCGARNKYEIFEEIQSDINLRAKQLLLDGRLFEYNCERCGFVTDAPYEMFYYDAKYNALIYFIEPSEVESVCMIMNETVKNVKMEWSELITNCQKRVVYHPRILQEKAKMFAMCMDDRVVEIVKVACMDKVCWDGLSPNKYMLFDMQDGAYRFKLFIDGTFTTIDFPYNIYEHIKEKFRNVLEDNQDYIIDRNWAIDFMKKYKIADTFVK